MSTTRQAAIIVIIFSFFLGWLGTAVQAEEIQPAVQWYRVNKGDTLWLLSQRYGTTFNQIQVINQVGDNLTEGQRLFVPVTRAGNVIRYTVQKADTLFLIAQRVNRTIAAIKAASNLTTDTLMPGQTLWIPLERPGVKAYIVAPGDSLFLIARNQGTTVQGLLEFNQLISDQIMVGQIIEIPLEPQTPAPAPIPAPAPSPAPTPTPIPAEVTVYRVVPGDSLGPIAQKFKTTADAIYQTNKLNSMILMPGQPLYLPVGSSQPVKVVGPLGEQKPGYGEFLDWEWARWIYNVGAVATIKDLDTGLTFRVRHMGGENHADSEPLTSSDTATMKKIFNGQWSWQTRAVLLYVGDRMLAASIAGQPHDVQTITDNNFPGHFDTYFWNSRSHNTNEIKSDHQSNVLRAAGRQ